MATLLKVDVFFSSLDRDGVYCVVILHIVLVTNEKKGQDLSEAILEEKDTPKIWKVASSITVGSATTGVHVHWLSYRIYVEK